MSIEEILKDKSVKPKQKTEKLAGLLLNKSISGAELIAFAKDAKDPIKATCIEAIEFATKKKPELADQKLLEFVTNTLTENAPRIKWESAKVIGNIAQVFPRKLEKPVGQLLINTRHEGTVVRWSAAFALAEIFKLKTNLNTELRPQLEKIVKNEEKGSIKKIYLKALKETP